MVTGESFEEKWMRHYMEVMAFMEQNHRRPSKHYADERNMHNWIKANRKAMLRGRLSANRLAQFMELLKKTRQYRRVNQYSYAPSAQELELPFGEE